MGKLEAELDDEHVFFGADGKKIDIPPGSVEPAFLAEGIHTIIDPSLIPTLPSRSKDGSPRGWILWYITIVLTGIGMFNENFTLTATGQINTIWTVQYPECWKTGKSALCPNHVACCGVFKNNPFEVNNTCQVNMVDSEFCQASGSYPENLLCRKKVLNSITYAEFAGITFGMLALGYLVDVIGRVATGILSSSLMIIGITVMVFTSSNNVDTIFLLFSIFFGIYGVGIGGEYPLTAMNASEYHSVELDEKEMDDEARHKARVALEMERTLRRGEVLGLVFTNQGVGGLVSSLLILIFVYFSEQGQNSCADRVNGITSGTNSMGVNPGALNVTWRAVYLIGGIIILFTLNYRGLFLDDEGGHASLARRRERRAQKYGPNVNNRARIIWNYLPRLIGTGGNWLVNDWAFYGLKLFGGPIFNAINPGGSLIVQNGYLVLFNFVALIGYYAACFVIDIPWIGRKRLQMVSFIIVAIIFFIARGVIDTASPQALLALYIISGFFQQFGPNVTTYVMAAETYPAEFRGTCHGISAFLGKVGALLSGVVFSHIDTKTIFLSCGIVSIVGAATTFLFSVDVTHVPLSEHDAQLELLLQGRPEAYKGLLNHPKHLSNWELLTGRHGEYEEGWAMKLVEEEVSKHNSVHSTAKEESTN